MTPPIVMRVCRMTHAANDTGQTAQIFATLADEAWQQLGSRSLADLTVAEIAAHVDVEAGLAVAVAGDSVVLFGGCSAAEGYLADTYVLDTKIWRWERVRVRAATPSRSRACLRRCACVCVSACVGACA